MSSGNALMSLISDDKRFTENLIQIADKNRRPVQFRLNNVQKDLHKTCTGRDIILKSAQVGVTSFIMARFLKSCITVPNTTSVVIAHEEFITQRLLAKAKFFEASIPPELKPEMTHGSAYELKWAEINSTFYIGSARSFVFGRGERIDNALLSEYAFWSDPEKILVPLGERVPLGGNIVIESTPNGEGNSFCELWLSALRDAGKTIYTPHFYPWWCEQGYRIPAGSVEALVGDRVSPLKLTDEEEELSHKHNLTEEQIRWRRRKLSELKSLFFQEYPEDPVGCFLIQSESVFNPDTINEKMKQCYGAADSYLGTSVWHPPVQNEVYIIGADSSFGQHDLAAATVWDYHNRLCASYARLCPPQEFAVLLRELGQYYNNACLVVEANSSGLVVLQNLMTYPNLWFQRDLVTGKLQTKPGWYTSKTSKVYLVQKFQQLLPTLLIQDIELVRQLRSLRFVGYDLVSVGQDDLLMSAMIALTCRDMIPARVNRGLVGTVGWRW